MELIQDWITTQDLFQSPESPAPVWVITEKGRVVEVLDPGEKLSGENLDRWIGVPAEQIQTHLNAHLGQGWVSFEREEIDQMWSSALEEPTFSRQLDKHHKALSLPVARKHFMLDALEGPWNRILPSQYGVVFCIEDEKEKTGFFVKVSKGRLDQMVKVQVPPAGAGALAMELELEHRIRIQGISMKEEFWNELACSGSPWRKIASGLRERQVKLSPFRVSILGVFLIKGALDLFRRA